MFDVLVYVFLLLLWASTHLLMPSTIWAVFMDGSLIFSLPSMIWAVFMDGRANLRLRTVQSVAKIKIFGSIT